MGVREYNLLEHLISHDSELFSQKSKKSIKDTMFDSSSKPNGILHVVIAEMGLDCPNVRRVIHCSPSNDVEAYNTTVRKKCSFALISEFGSLEIVLGLMIFLLVECACIYSCGSTMQLFPDFL